jgi:hypothetical protein
VRHEAGEALGAIGRPECLAALRAHADDAAPEVAETCRLALQRIEWLQAAAAAAKDGSGGGGEGVAAVAAADGSGESPYMSVDPTPPLPADTPVDKLRAILLDPNERMFEVGWPGLGLISEPMAARMMRPGGRCQERQQAGDLCALCARAGPHDTPAPLTHGATYLRPNPAPHNPAHSATVRSSRCATAAATPRWRCSATRCRPRRRC